jgi:hypothetical protein
MKIILQVLLHGLFAAAGFWLAGKNADTTAETSRAASRQPLAKSASAARPLLSPPKPSSEDGIAMLNYANWAGAITPISQMSLDELPAMLRGLLRNPFPEVRRRLLRSIFERWAALDLNGALTALRGMSSPQHKESALRAVLDLWVKTDADSAMNWLATLDDDSVLQEVGIELLLYRKASSDPLASAAWADQIEDIFLREKALSQIGLSWMSGNAANALMTLPTVEPKRLRDYLLAHLCHRTGIDHAAGLEFISQLPTHAERSRLSEDWLTAYANHKPQEAFEWLRSHSERPDLQKAAYLLGSQISSSAKTSAELHAMALQLPAGALRDAFTASAAERWAESGHSLTEAQALLTLCGPCIEREQAEARLQQIRTKP